MSLLELLSQQLDDQAIQNMGRQLGADPQSTSKAVNAALPMLVGALANNTKDQGGAQSLAGALDRDHDGSILDDVAGFLGGGQSAGLGAGILKHMLGGRRQGTETAIGRASGLDSGQAGQLLAMLAPLVMGALAKTRQSSQLDAGDLAGMLANERRQVEQAQPQAGSLLNQVIDRDGDGNIADDIAEIGAGLLGSFLKSRR